MNNVGNDDVCLVHVRAIMMPVGQTKSPDTYLLMSYINCNFVTHANFFQ